MLQETISRTYQCVLEIDLGVGYGTVQLIITRLVVSTGTNEKCVSKVRVREHWSKLTYANLKQHRCTAKDTTNPYSSGSKEDKQVRIYSPLRHDQCISPCPNPLLSLNCEHFCQ